MLSLVPLVTYSDQLSHLVSVTCCVVSQTSSFGHRERSATVASQQVKEYARTEIARAIRALRDDRDNGIDDAVREQITTELDRIQKRLWGWH